MNFDRRLMRLLSKYSSLFFSSIFCTICAGGAIVGIAWNLTAFVDRLFLKKQPLEQLHPVLIWFAVFVVIRLTLLITGQALRNAIALKLKRHLRDLFVDHLEKIGPIGVRGVETGTVTSVLSKGIDSLETYFSEYLPQVFLSVTIPLVLIAWSFPASITAGIIMIFTVPLIPVFMILIGSAAKTKSQEQWQKRIILSSRFLDLLQGIVTLKLLGRSRAQIESLRSACNQFRDATLNVLKIAFLSALVLELLATLSVAVIAVSIGIKLINGNIEFFDAFFVLVIAPDVYMPMRKLGAMFHAGMDGLVSAQNIYDVVEIEPCENELNKSCNPHDSSAIVLDNISLTYQNTGRTALSGLNLTIERGKTTAIVGETGAGKSSIFNLLLGFVGQTEGKIKLNSNSIGWLPQRPYIFNNSVADNIRISRQDASMDEVIEAARKAHIHDFIITLPQQYDTPVGENGTRLSGGQAKRVAIARVFLKNADLLLMDESTSDLDQETEHLIMDSLNNLADRCTIVTIAHRLRTVRQADSIVVMDKGSVVEKGSYEQLVGQNGFFSSLIEAGRQLS